MQKSPLVSVVRIGMKLPKPTLMVGIPKGVFLKANTVYMKIMLREMLCVLEYGVNL